ncbi:MAG TPA: hypothetical protein VJ768_06035 [Anaerolineales bacterium]|nr:hypothetical protein [Anaerolineales bacterium]
MADIRCPMCGKLNPSDLEICQFCEARLIPLAPGAPLDEPRPSREVPEEPDEHGDPAGSWLDDLRGEDEEEDYPSLDADEAEVDSQDWLGRIGSEEPIWTPEPEAQTDASPRPEPEFDWSEPSVEGSDDSGDLPAMAFSGQGGEAEDDLPDWLKSIESGPPAGDAGSDEPSSGHETLEIPGLVFRSAREDQAEAPGFDDSPEEDDFLAEPGQLPDWLQEEQDAAPGELPDWLQGQETAVPGQLSDEPSLMAGEADSGLPDWLQKDEEAGSGNLPDWLQDGEDVDRGGPPAGLAMAAAEELPAMPGEEPGTTDWLTESPEAETEGLPDWLEVGAAAAAFDAARSLAGDESGAEPPLESFPARPEPGTTDWLQDEAQAGPGELPGETPAMAEEGDGLPDWLQDEEAGSDQIAEGVPMMEGEGEADLPEWLAAEEVAESSEGPAGAAEAGPDSQDWLTGGSEEESGELPDWLKAGAVAGLAAEPLAGTDKGDESDDWLQEDEDADSGELPDWLKAGAAAAALGAAAGALRGESDEPESPLGESAEQEPSALPDWLHEGREGELWDLEREAPEAAAGEAGTEGLLAQEVGGSTSWIETGEGPLDPNMPLSLEEEDVPDWLKSLQSAQDDVALGAAVEQGVDSLQAPSGDPAEMVEEGEIPGWLEDLTFAVPAIAIETEGAGQFPEVKAPVESFDEQLPDTGEAEIEPILPGVLQDAFAESEGMETPAMEAEGEGDLAPADLPAWLKAMRPVEAVAAVSPFIGEGGADLSIEGAGPLAGLQGVLPADPGVAHSRSSAMGSMRVDVTKNQYDHVALLKSIVKDEIEPLQYEEKRALIQPAHILRWVIAVALIAFLLLPLLTGAVGSSQPVFLPDETLAANQAIAALQPGQKVLVSFDYQPGLSGEMDAVAEPILQDLLRRQVLLTLVSTSPTGPALAETSLSEAGLVENFSLTHGQNYLNLGYIPGGAAGLQFFALNPQAVLTVPFNLSGFTENPYGAWSSPPLQGVSSLSNYALALVITDDAGVARAWVEQVSPSLGATPLIMAASGQAAPLVRPYFETVPPQVDGLVSGLLGGISYQQLAPATTLASTYWEAYNNGILVAIVLIIAGGFYGTVASLLRRRKEEAAAKPALDKAEPEAEAGVES